MRIKKNLNNIYFNKRYFNSIENFLKQQENKRGKFKQSAELVKKRRKAMWKILFLLCRHVISSTVERWNVRNFCYYIYLLSLLTSLFKLDRDVCSNSLSICHRKNADNGWRSVKFQSRLTARTRLIEL